MRSLQVPTCMQGNCCLCQFKYQQRWAGQGAFLELMALSVPLLWLLIPEQRGPCALRADGASTEK